MRELQDGDFPFANDFNSIVQAMSESAGIRSGCTVDDGGTSDMTVSVAAGTARFNNSNVSVGSQSVTLNSADPDNDRYDLVVVDDTGTASAVTGTASSTPTAPSIPANSALLAIVYVQAGTSAISNADINDARGEAAPLPAEYIEASETDDGSDITHYKESRSNGSIVVDITGSGVLLGGQGVGGGDDGYSVDITVDGGTTFTFSGGQGRDSQGEYISAVNIPAIKFESSLTIQTTIGSTNETGITSVWVKQ